MPSSDYVQPDTNAYVKNGYSFLRLKQYLASAGDIFESEQGANGFGLGPDSDISRVSIAYLDEQAPETFQSLITLSPQRTFGAPIVAFNESKQYAPSNVPGRILIWPAELYDDEYLPSTFSPVNDRLIFEKPVIDILQYFSPPSDLAGVRADKTYYYDSLRFGVDDCYVLIPFYGRRYASIIITNTGAAAFTAVTVFGVNFRIDEDLTTPSGASAVEFQISTGGLAAAATDAREIVAASTGLFDYLLLQFDPAAATNASLRVTVSDDAG